MKALRSITVLIFTGSPNAVDAGRAGTDHRPALQDATTIALVARREQGNSSVQAIVRYSIQ
jgi:hypothetical protein